MSTSVNFQLAIRQSFVAKLGVYLQQNASRDMSIPLNFNNGTADFEFNGTTYGIVPKVIGEQLFYPGVNLIFFGEEDITHGRSTASKKRYSLTTKIVVAKPIEGHGSANVAAAEVIGVCRLLLQALSDGRIQIWDYSVPATPVFTGVSAIYNDQPYSFKDESLALPGGDVRMGATITAQYLDLSL